MDGKMYPKPKMYPNSPTGRGSLVFKVSPVWPQFKTRRKHKQIEKGLDVLQSPVYDRVSAINMSLGEHSSSIMTDDEDEEEEVTTSRSAPLGVGASGYGLRGSTTRRGPQGAGGRHRPYTYHSLPTGGPSLGGTSQEAEPGYVMIPKPENPVEAHRLINNYTFGFKIWKGHVTERPLEVRSEIVKELYSDTQTPSEVSTLRPGNILYVFMFGWWVALFYLIVALIMLLTVVGRSYARFCLVLADYFFWPFGKFVHKDDMSHHIKQEQSPLIERATFQFSSSNSAAENGGVREEIPLIGRRRIQESTSGSHDMRRQARTYVWFALGYPLLVIVHFIAFVISWFLVVFIPVSKINSKAIRKILLMQPEQLAISKSSYSSDHPNTDIVTYTHQAVNIYYYKYTVDGMNVIAVNLLVFVIVSLLLGFLDHEHKLTSATTKFVLSLFAIIPLAYYIGMGITSLAAQTNFAIGAVLNATFGSAVEITLYVLVLKKGRDLNSECYEELVKASLVGTLLATMMLVPGLCMVVGGLRHANQTFNPHSAVVSSTLLFVSVAGAFAPTIFSKAFGRLICKNCHNISTSFQINGTNETEYHYSLECSNCDYNTAQMNHTSEFYVEYIQPLVYVCAILLPIAYIVGLIFSLKTHRTQIHDTFMEQLQEGESGASLGSHGHAVAHWGRVKSLVILLVSTVLMSLCADIITENTEVLLNNSSVTVYFIGVTLFALTPNIPEIVNGIQFALHNNITLSIEVGCSIALQVCLLQIPIIIFLNLLIPMHFTLVFDDIHLWSVVFAVLMMNYVFQDGKSDYFQGFAVCLVYLALIAMYFFAPNNESLNC